MSEPNLPGGGGPAGRFAPARPYRETEDGDRSAELVKLVAEIPPRPVDVGKGWDDVIERVARPKSSAGRWMLMLAAAAAVLLAWVSMRPASPMKPAPVTAAVVAECEAPMMCVEGARAPAPAVAPPVPRGVAKATRAAVPEAAPAPLPEPLRLPEHVLAATDSVWSIPVEGTLDLRRGHVEVKPHADSYAVTTPELTMASSNARFAADVTEAGTVVHVFEGEVEVFSYADRRQVTLRAGDEHAFAPGGVPTALDMVPPEASSPACARHSFEQRIACLQTEGKGDGLRAQAALYEAAYLLVRAGRAPTAALTLRESLRRFPHGVLGPEVRFALIKALVAQGRLAEAGAMGREFLAQCPTDPRTDLVESFLRNLDWLESR